MSYHPPCQICFRTSKLLIGEKNNNFKFKFLCRIFPNILNNFTEEQYLSNNQLIEDCMNNIKIKILFGSCDINRAQSFDLFSDNPPFIGVRVLGC